MVKKIKDKSKYDIGRTLPNRRGQFNNRPSPVKFEEDFQKSSHKKTKRRFITRRLLPLALLLLFVPLIFIAVWDAINISRAAEKMFGSGNLWEIVDSSQLKGSDRGRVNVLLVGYSVDDPGHPGATLTDSIMLLSMDTKNYRGYMLSIPRDLYVQIPGYGYGKINEAFEAGNRQRFHEAGYPNGGIGLLEKVVSENFGVPVDYYAIINYAAVRQTVNALGGITVKIDSPDARGLYDPTISPVDGGPLRLKNGWHRLDGQTALNLTRARGASFNSYGFPEADFNRTQHQRQVLLAIKDEVDWSLILNPRRNSQFFDALAGNIKTDIELSEARPMAALFNKVNSTDLASVSLRKIGGRNLLQSYAAPGGLSALIPAAGLSDYSQIKAAIKSLEP